MNRRPYYLVIQLRLPTSRLDSVLKMTSKPAVDENHAATAGDKRKRVEHRAKPKEEPESAKDDDEEANEVKDEDVDQKGEPIPPGVAVLDKA
jgi:hypothetical protein